MKNKKIIQVTTIVTLFLLTTALPTMALDNPTIIATVAETSTFMVFAGVILAMMPSVSVVLKTILDWLLSIFTFLSVISFIITGIMFIFSGSNPELKERAKSGVTYSIIGIVAGLSGYIILNTISNLLTNSI